MSTERNKCPYFVSMSSQKITCRGFETGCKVERGYARSGAGKAHYTEFCGRSYHRCEIAQMLNSVWHEIKVQVCPHNSGVDCINTAECDRCGWNPVVAAERLRKWMELHSCDT